MAGNVFEWTASSDMPGKAILKGGSWDDLGGICRAAARHERPVESRHILIGFRCLCDLP
jgi:formylglycine-generating enzyme required for sulfatase activity